MTTPRVMNNSRRHARFRGVLIALAAGVLLGGAVYTVASAPDGFRAALQAATAAPARLIVLLMVFPVISGLLTSTVFWILTRRHAAHRLPWIEMAALIGASWAANYLPFKPGLMGRVAYHARVHGIAVRRSVAILAVAVAMGIAAALLAVALVRVGAAAPRWGLAILAAPLPIGLLLAAGLSRGSRCGAGLSAAFAVKYLDILAWAARFAIAFTIVSAPLSRPQSVVLSAIGQATSLVPWVGNGLGLQEWVVSFAAVKLPEGAIAGGAPASSANDEPSAEPKLTPSHQSLQESIAGPLAAMLVSRASELVVAVPIGLACTLWLGRRGRSQPVREAAGPGIP